jgi:hypothetical protein
VRSGRRQRETAAAAFVALVAFLPFARGVFSGASLYFRDLSLHFFPLRRFALEGLRAGELRFWNPYVHEGVPLTLPSLGYPLDLLALAWPHEPLLSLLLALHVPLGAFGFLLLARGLGLRPVGACAGALVYALGGFLLSTVNLYVYAQAAAWAPFVVLGLVRVLDGGGSRAVAGTALAVALSLSTTGVEIVAQAILAGVWLGLGPRQGGRAALRGLGALALGMALAAPVLVLVAGQVEGSARGQGFTPDVVLAHSIHPFSLLQTVVGGLYGNLANLANEWWGQNFFPRGFPYVLSLYLGAATLALAAAGAVSGRPYARRLALLGALAVLVALGRWAGFGGLVEQLGALRIFRFPVKAFFSAHLAVSLLAGLGLSALSEGRRARTLAAVASAAGVLLAAAPLLPRVLPETLARFALAFFPPGFPPDVRAALLQRVLEDAAVGGAVAIGVGLLAGLAALGLVPFPRAAWLVAALVVADLLRTGAALNPMLPRRVFEPSAELAARLPALREGRVFTCPIESSPAYRAGRVARGQDHEAWSFALLRETLSPACNVPQGIGTALSPDLTMLVPVERLLPEPEGACRDLDALVPRLRAAGVTTVLSLDPLDHAQLEPAFVLAPARVQPLAVHAYRLRDPLARLALGGAGRAVELERTTDRLELQAEAEADTTLTVREAWAPGWTARVDGGAVAMTRARHLEIALPAGRHRVQLTYRPPRLAEALGASGLALGLLVALVRPRTASPAAATSPASDTHSPHTTERGR